MKSINRFLAAMIAVIMIMAMIPTAFAANDGSIKITNPVEDQTYSAYRIFDLESFDKEAGAYIYAVNDAWSGFEDTIKTYFDIEDGYVTGAKTDADVAAFAKVALAYAKANNMTPDGTAKTAEEGDTVISNLPLGYYLVDSTLGSLCALDTTDKAAEVQEKNTTTTIDKTVKEDSTREYGDSNTADIGQTVEFKTEIKAYKGAQNFVLHDKMTAGLTFGTVTDVKVGDTSIGATNYTVVTDEDELEDTNPCTFHIVFAQSYLDTITVETTITVYYTATVNENAVVKVAEENETWLDYGEENSTTHDKTETFTYGFNVFKYTGADKEPLGGAKFKLTLNDTDKTVIKFTKEADATTGEEVYRVDPSGTVTEIVTTTDSGAKFILRGLDADTYVLTETEAPVGYNKADPITVVIAEDGTVKVNNVQVTTVEVENKTGAVLPSTGGMGTTLFYIVGGILVVGAGILLVSKKRMSETV